MNQKPSECIEQFLEFIQEAPAKHDKARQDISTADREVQDILHWLEFHYNATTGLGPIMRMVAAETDAQRRRREAKKTEEVFSPVSEWALSNAGIKKSLEKLLEKVRGIEKDMENRKYTDKTDIMDRILGPDRKIMENREND